MKNYSKGSVTLILIIIAVLVIGGIYLYYNKTQNTEQVSSSKSIESPVFYEYSDADKAYTLYKYNLQTQKKDKLFTGQVKNGSPAVVDKYSEDTVYVNDYAEGKPLTSLVNIKKGTKTDISYEVPRPFLSPDNKTLIYAGEDKDGLLTVVVKNLETNKDIVIPSNSANDFGGCGVIGWSTDSSIAYCHPLNGKVKSINVTTGVVETTNIKYPVSDDMYTYVTYYPEKNLIIRNTNTS
jgi:hypothetical protein